MPAHKPPEHLNDKAPFRIGDRVRGISYVHPDRFAREQPEPFEGVVVQVGSGWAGVDAEHAYVWSRLDDHTERKSLVIETELLQRAEERHDGPHRHQGL
ncbi:hypothetical protein ACQUSR_09405 [Streptomyces sp. P1-3]|uniref:hypothetical protein n=1 Tax=Streptomyces sp. P1-3 TaxID=3421658 RepID=UPI003D3649CB